MPPDDFIHKAAACLQLEKGTGIEFNLAVILNFATHYDSVDRLQSPMNEL